MTRYFHQIGDRATPNAKKCYIIIQSKKSLPSFILLMKLIFSHVTCIYYIAKPVLGKSQRSDWCFLGRAFAVRTVSMETAQSVYFCFGAKPANL